MQKLGCFALKLHGSNFKKDQFLKIILPDSKSNMKLYDSNY